MTFDDIFITIHDVDGQGAEEKLIKATKSKLSRRIQKEVRGHARRFSNVTAWVEAAAKSSSAKDGLASVDERSKSTGKLSRVIRTKSFDHFSLS